jgi:salicylate hydroxylase
MKALIAGGGIGGLTAALCLASRGITVEVFERSSAFREIGAGIQISPNAARVLHALGLETAIRERAFLPQATQFRDWRSGAVISERPLGAQTVSRYGAPYYHLHRGDLMRLLEAAARQAPRITLHTGAQVQSIERPADDRAPVRLTVFHQGGLCEHQGDLLIGADGIHSIVRDSLWGPSKPSFTGNVAWRALVPSERLPRDLIRPMSTAWWGPQKHFVHYYVRGGALVNCVCVVEKQGWEIESWTEHGSLAELQQDFSGWHDDLQHLISQIDETALFKWALFDREPMPRWGQGCMTLLGDACHPTLPFMAQGAAMAIEDAAVLALCLSDPAASAQAQAQESSWRPDAPYPGRVAASLREIPARLQRYEDLRRDRTAGIQTGSRRNARTFHLSGEQAEARNLALRDSKEHAMDAIYAYDAFRVNSNP